MIIPRQIINPGQSNSKIEHDDKNCAMQIAYRIYLSISQRQINPQITAAPETQSNNKNHHLQFKI
ncbi:hypothetical protein Glove_84g83 [Diversispora epigaea]|uniref:Uncharacterized protein n=1 Tax=Diversispora epigaea TaxID=1348612 RepID=A0A397J763_9GLOM|nr:hypothetical protein Glove_84g83 [Diversispora epigaea]